MTDGCTGISGYRHIKAQHHETFCSFSGITCSGLLHRSKSHHKPQDSRYDWAPVPGADLVEVRPQRLIIHASVEESFITAIDKIYRRRQIQDAVPDCRGTSSFVMPGKLQPPWQLVQVIQFINHGIHTQIDMAAVLVKAVRNPRRAYCGGCGDPDDVKKCYTNTVGSSVFG